MDATEGTTARLNTVEEVMDRLRIGRSTAFELIGSRRLRSVKVGRRRLVSEAALVQFIEELDRQTDEPSVMSEQGRSPSSGHSALQRSSVTENELARRGTARSAQ